MTELAELKNIGPKTIIWLHQVGVYDHEDIERLGVVEVYRRLKAAYPDQVTLNALWSLQGALLNLPYTRLPQAMKDGLLAELDSIPQDEI